VQLADVEAKGARGVACGGEHRSDQRRVAAGQSANELPFLRGNNYFFKLRKLSFILFFQFYSFLFVNF
jgi:hypothetical protein